LPRAAKAVGGTLKIADQATRLDDPRVGELRGKAIAMAPQDALLALDPVMRVGEQIAEGPRVHRGASIDEARRQAVGLLAEVGLPEPEKVARAFPHELSGGMRQRALLAAALSGGPKVLIADEPTSALDASVQGLVLALLRKLAASRGLGVLLITHDLQVVRDACDDVTVLYAGRVAEQGPVAQVLERPRHPYTQALLRARPSVQTRGAPLEAIEGQVPSVREDVAGCRFHPRCAKATARCRTEVPALAPRGAEVAVACHEVSE
jgi:oligopeptide/dipeptide ABC transporter ATP-binding protein